MKKTLIAVVSTVLICCCVFGGTLAWLMDETEPIINTFTFGNVDITLTETGATDNAKTFKMVPGEEKEKDPTVTVVGGSETCWLFVKIDKSSNLDTFIDYDVADGWNELSTGVYYREVTTSENDQPFAVLAGNKVTVNDTVTKDMIGDLTVDTYPKLTFTAYAVQKAEVDTAAAAWAIANPNP